MPTEGELLQRQIDKQQQQIEALLAKQGSEKKRFKVKVDEDDAERGFLIVDSDGRRERADPDEDE